MDDHRLLPRFRRFVHEARQARQLAPLLQEEGRALPVVTAGRSELDRDRLRGIPVVGGAPGAIAGSSPGRSRRLDEWRPTDRSGVDSAFRGIEPDG